MMNRKIIGLTLCAMALNAPLFAQSNPIYVQFAPGAVKGALYKPDSGPAPHVAVLLIHRTSNFLAAPATRELSKRGFMVLAVNPRSDNNEAAVNFEANRVAIHQVLAVNTPDDGGSGMPATRRSFASVEPSVSA